MKNVRSYDRERQELWRDISVERYREISPLITCENWSLYRWRTQWSFETGEDLI
jgi:hypothetical protein